MCERRNIWNISEYFTCTVMSKMFRFLTLYRWGIWITNSIQPFVHDSHPTISNEETFLWCTLFCLACLNILLHTGVLPVAKGLTLMSHRKIRYELLWVSYWFTVRMKGEREKERERKRERWESLGRDRERGGGVVENCREVDEKTDFIVHDLRHRESIHFLFRYRSNESILCRYI